MFTRFRTVWRQVARNRRLTRAAVPAIIAVSAIAIVVGLLYPMRDEAVNQAALGSCVQAGASGSAAPDSASGGSPAPDASGAYSSAPYSSAPCPSGAASSTAAPSQAASGGASPSASSGPVVLVRPDTFSNGPAARRELGDVATAPVDGTGAAISLNQSPEQAANSGNCTLVVPAYPLTAQGLASPYQLGDGCSEANPVEQAFVEATILSPNGNVQVYNPLVITQGTTPAAAPVVPTIPRGARVILDMGFNGTNLLLEGPGAFENSSGCVDALGQSVIGQVSACDAVPFYKFANTEIARGILKVPSLGTGTDGQACQDTRNFALVDQDPSDNTYSQYLLNGNGQTAQATPANKGAMSGATVLSNGSDNGLLGYFVDPANNCVPFTKSDITSANGVQSSQALNELSARANQHSHIALVPPNDEMVLVNGGFSIAKTNAYRSLVDQPLLTAKVSAPEVAAAFCMNMVNIGPAHDQADMAQDANFTSPVPNVGNNLANFLGNRMSMAFQNLNCGDFGLTDPVTVTVDGNGVATAVTYNTGAQQATIPAAEAGSRSRYGQGGKGQHMAQNPSGM
jgi:hypothetical protein